MPRLSDDGSDNRGSSGSMFGLVKLRSTSASGSLYGSVSVESCSFQIQVHEVPFRLRCGSGS
ncbi:hypothetical protein Hanom_Chr17g01561331 [Helianthus anomalus]